jgi:hypothetical protein
VRTRQSADGPRAGSARDPGGDAAVAQWDKLSRADPPSAEQAFDPAQRRPPGQRRGQVVDLSVRQGGTERLKVGDDGTVTATSFTGSGAGLSNIPDTALATGSVTNSKIQDNAVTSAKIVNDTILNEDINASAGIVYSKLTLTDSIVDNDIKSNAAIATI